MGDLLCLCGRFPKLFGYFRSVQAVGSASNSQAGFKLAGVNQMHNLLEIVIIRRKEK
jgi:hypothetical protein